MLLRILDVDGRLVDDGREVLDLGVALLQRVLLLLLLLVAATELILLRALRDLTGIYFHSSFSSQSVNLFVASFKVLDPKYYKAQINLAHLPLLGKLSCQGSGKFCAG